MRTFYEFGLDNQITRALDNMGFEEATPIQEQAIPIAMTGKDIIGQAQTGTGKTVAFGIPLMEKITKDTEHVQGIVITPTRELAMQVAEELYKLGQFKGVRTLPIYGGQDISRQIRSLKKKPQIIVGTPGRLLDHLRRKTLRLQNISTVVLDEADEMLNMGFIEDIEAILAEVPKEKQVLLFSATMPKRIELLAQKFMNSPELVKTKAKEMTVPNIEQYYMEVKEKDKFDVLTRLLDIENPELSIIFGRTKRRVDELSEALSKRGYLAEGTHGDLSQAIRNKVLKKFKDKSVDILVATDVAARGLDINDVTHIFNFDIPQDPEGYVHRIGRTGRAGKTGMALTFVTPREIDHLKVIENITKKKMTKKPIPSMIDAMEGQKQVTVEKILGMIKEGNINQYKGIAEELLEQYDSVTLLSTTLKMLTKEPDTTPINLTEESPLRMKKNNQKPKGRRAFDKGRSHNKDKSFDKGKKRNDKRRPRKKQKSADSK